ncbi:MAG: hypothetical protein ACLURV_03660 [Gallintestinimicrobium sp.]
MDITLFYREKERRTVCSFTWKWKGRSYFKHQIEHFCDRYRVIAPDAEDMENLPGTSPFTIRSFRVIYMIYENHRIRKL